MMHRDMDLIRELLLRLERSDRSLPQEREVDLVNYHLHQMKEAGLVDAEIVWANRRGHRFVHFAHVHDITPKGHDFIAAIRNDTFWGKLKKHFDDKAVPMTVDLAVEAAKILGKTLLAAS